LQIFGINIKIGIFLTEPDFKLYNLGMNLPSPYYRKDSK
jgi:hypothetical protein